MKYCVLVKISKQQLGFWYQLEGGAHTSLSINVTNTIPLCFYVNGNDFKIGDFAKERFLVNDKNAFNDYFEIIKDPVKHFTLHGDSKPVKQLLYYGVENYLSHFIKTILYKNESIEGFRTTFCLRFWFDDDIENQEKVLVENIFKEAGYENVDEVNSDLFLNKELNIEINSSRSRVCLSSITNDLYVKLYKSPDFKLVSQTKLEKMGSDPRAKIIAKLILEDIKEASPHIHIDEELEIPHIINHCTKLLSSLSPIMRNDLELSNGVRTDYKIRLAQLEERLIYNRGIEDKVIPQLESILSANGMSSSSVDIILNGDELNTNYFKDKLTKKFSNVYGVASKINDKLLKLIFTDISSNGYQLNPKVSSFSQVDPITSAEETIMMPTSRPIIPPASTTRPAAAVTPPISRPVTPPISTTRPAAVVTPPLPPNRVVPPPVPPVLKPPPLQQTKVSAPPLPPGVKQPPVPPTKVGSPPVPPGVKPPPPPPPPPKNKK
jgi:hypothetical protein